MDAELHNGKWVVGNLPEGFDWKFLDFLPELRGGGTAGRLDHSYYLYHYASLLPDNSRIVEIGTAQGASAIVMGTGIRGKNSIILTIDPGMMSDEEVQSRRDELTKYELLLGNLHHVMQNIRAARLEGYIVPIPDTSENALKRWDGRKIDMLYVDGSHTYEDVKKDCLWMQYVKHGGVAVFDDWIEPVEKAVMEYVAAHREWELLTRSTDQPPKHPWKTVFWRN
ncbi:MAG: class I SAM-dependent methyltransferase [Solirubrobacteraceae bacterium]|nr:class I SAM-dependent methyltransferase [Solirubrobacteraceae bacterium]